MTNIINSIFRFETFDYLCGINILRYIVYA